jgi:glycosyltransferase involved in cell wall biosynthesis
MTAPATARHVVVLSFGYEPLAHVSAKRPSRMARELAALGFDVTVITVDWRPHPPATPLSVEQAVEAALRQPAPRAVAIDGRLSDPGFDPERVPRTTEPPPPRNPVARRARTLRDMFGWGAYAGWARLAYEAARRIHRARPIDVVWAIHGDNSCHAVARRLRGGEGIPWVADFKDPWSVYFPSYAHPVQRWATDRRLRTAAAVTETCAAQAAEDAETFGRPTEVVYSGYDADAMAAAVPKHPGGGFAVAYTGTVGHNLHDTRVLPGLFGALQRRGAIDRYGVQLHHYARTTGDLRGLLAGVVPESAVVDHGWLDERETFSVMKGVDLLLLLAARFGQGKLVGVKELEYFASGTPVLHLGEPLAEMVPVVRACPQVHVAQTLDEAVSAFERVIAGGGRGSVNPPALAGYTWGAQAARLAAVLERVARAS